MAAALGVVWLGIYLLTLSPTVNYIDSGELITALHEPGVAHPPGYPLYTLLGYVVSHLPVGEVAWRVNLISALAAASAVAVLFLLICAVQEYTLVMPRKRESRRVGQKSQARRGSLAGPTAAPSPPRRQLNWYSLLAAAAASCLVGGSATFWNRAIQAKMYTLHYLFVVAIFLFAVNARRAYDEADKRAARKWFIAAVAALGLSLTNHLITTLLFPGVALLLIWGPEWVERIRWHFQQWKAAVPAFVAPLLLYLYLPIRSSQSPVMNWGSPDNLGDFWRHVSGWQYSVYLGEDLNITLGRFWNFLASQWSWLGWLVVPLALAAGALLARTNPAVFAGTALTGLATIVFSLKYGSSEMVPYIVPLYIMLALWLGAAPACLSVIMTRRADISLGDMSRTSAVRTAIAPALAVLAIVSTAFQYPQQNHSNDHLAEQFALNIYNNLEPNSIILTDLWDFASPSYYLQLVQGVRPDVVIIDKLLLKYPWYVGQLEKRYPWLIANSKDLVEPYKAEQRKWVNGQPYDGAKINQLYIQLMSSFVERNIATHPSYVFFSVPCDPNTPPQYCENNQIAPTMTRQQAGVALRLFPQAPSSGELPPIPKFDLRGFTYDKTPLDDFAKLDGEFYVDAYRNTAQAYAQANRSAEASSLLSEAEQLDNEIRNR